MEEGERARRDPDMEAVGEIWDSESLKDLGDARNWSVSYSRATGRRGQISGSCNKSGTLEAVTHLMAAPFSSVLSRDGAAFLEPWDAAREALEAGPAVGVEGKGFTVMLERALSVLEPVIELKREAASFLPIVTNGSGAEQRSRLGGQGHSNAGRDTGAFRSFHHFIGLSIGIAAGLDFCCSMSSVLLHCWGSIRFDMSR